MKILTISYLEYHNILCKDLRAIQRGSCILESVKPPDKEHFHRMNQDTDQHISSLCKLDRMDNLHYTNILAYRSDCTNYPDSCSYHTLRLSQSSRCKHCDPRKVMVGTVA